MQGDVFLFEVADLCRSGDEFAAFSPPRFGMLRGRGLMKSDLGTFLAEVTILGVGRSRRSGQAVGSKESDFSSGVDALSLELVEFCQSTGFSH